MYKKLKYYNKNRKTIGDLAMARIGHHTRPSSLSMSICRSYCCLAWQISILQLHELNQKPSSCRVNHHMYELYVGGHKIRLSSTPLKPAEPTPRNT